MGGVRVLLVYPDVGTFGGSYYTGVASLAASLKARGHECRLLHVTRAPRKAEVQRLARAWRPGLVGISVTSLQLEAGRLLARWIREAVTTPVVFGGVHPTLCPEETIAHPEVDVVCVGEGEAPLAELAEALEAGRDVTGIANLWVRTAAGVVRNAPRPPAADLDALPWPDRSVFEFQRFVDRWGGVARTIASRGCPFSCTFCSNHALRAACGGPAVRVRTPESVVAELEAVRQTWRVRRFQLDDDVFTLDAGWVRELARLYPARVGLPFAVNGRVETARPELLQDLARAGCDEIAFGVESGSEWLRGEVLGKRITNRQVVEAFRAARAAGLRTCSLNMIGLPHETPAMAEETVRLNEALDPDRLQVTVFYPFPGTALHDLCRAHGWLSGRTKTSFLAGRSTLDLPKFPRQAVGRYHRRLRSMSFRRELRARRPWLLPAFWALEQVLEPLGVSAADVLIRLRHGLMIPLLGG
jgi:radical SAM superfamily enzyme YgiQ (UPF0313 family)